MISTTWSLEKQLYKHLGRMFNGHEEIGGRRIGVNSTSQQIADEHLFSSPEDQLGKCEGLVTSFVYSLSDEVCIVNESDDKVRLPVDERSEISCTERNSLITICKVKPQWCSV